MKMMIESTDKVTVIEGQRCRLWQGTTESGVPCKVFVKLIAVGKDDDSSQFDKELEEQLPPSRFVHLRQII